MSHSLQAAAAPVREALKVASAGLVERESLVELIVLTAIAKEHLLVVGPPGTAKSEAVRRVAKALGGQYFEYLLGRFTEPAEVFGPVDLQRLKEGFVETRTAGMLPEAEIAFLDEVFLGSTAILNTLLGLLNERTFRRGHTQLKVPLRVCIAASNAIPEEPALAAFADRFLVRVFVDSIPDSRLEELLAGGTALLQQPAGQTASMAQLDVLAEAARSADLAAVRSAIAHAVRLLRKSGVPLTDRRIVKVQRLVAAAAVLAGRPNPTEQDLWPILFAVPTSDAQAIAKDLLRDVLQRSQNDTLSSAAEAASASPLSRATRLSETAAALLSSAPVGGDAQALEQWKLKLEGVAREIDASFEPSQLPEVLLPLRQKLVETLGAP